MALIICPECGNRISEKAISCPHCGYPLTQEPETATFCLRREARSLFYAAKYEVYLDHQYWGILKNGDSLTADLELGIHHLKLNEKGMSNSVAFDADFRLNDNLTFTFTAAIKVKMQTSIPNCILLQPTSNKQQNRTTVRVAPKPAPSVTPIEEAETGYSSGRRECPKCGGIMAIQTVSETRKTGCGTILLYFILALTIFGLLIVIPLMLRKKTETVTYAVCQYCGYKKRIS